MKKGILLVIISLMTMFMFVAQPKVHAQATALIELTLYDSTVYVGGTETAVTTASNLQTLVTQPLFIAAEWDSIAANFMTLTGDTICAAIVYRQVSWNGKSTGTKGYGAWATTGDTIGTNGTVQEKTRDYKALLGRKGWIQLGFKFQNFALSATSGAGGAGSYTNVTTNTPGKVLLYPYQLKISLRRRA